MTTPRKNEMVDAAGMRPLTEHEQHDFSGIEGDPTEARIADLDLFGGIEGTLVLCEEALGVYWHDEQDDLRTFVLYQCPRMVRELVAVRLLTWQAGQHLEITEDLLQRLGFESIF